MKMVSNLAANGTACGAEQLGAPLEGAAQAVDLRAQGRAQASALGGTPVHL